MLRERSGSYGNFLGCSNHLRCSYTRDAQRAKGHNYKSAVAVPLRVAEGLPAPFDPDVLEDELALAARKSWGSQMKLFNRLLIR